MASALLRRLVLPKRAISRSISTSPARWTPEVTKNPLDTHTVEDLHGMSAAEILAETGTRADTKLRHFTGAFSCVFVLLFM
jgi:NADH dehydrogenase (ubiquinone) Fe-S protein 2